MEARFTEGWRAAGFVANEIAKELPEGNPLSGLSFEVTLHRRGTVLRRLCFTDQLEETLSALCADFPRSSAQFHPDSAYGFVAQIKCNCSRAGKPGCCMAQGGECAALTVVFSPNSLGVYEHLRAAKRNR